MAYDPSAVKPSVDFSDSPNYLGAWVCYINGNLVPIAGWSVTQGVWQIPQMTIHVIPDTTLIRLGYQDRVQVALFYLDHWYDPTKPRFCVLGTGEIVGWGWSFLDSARVMSFDCMASIEVFQQLYFHYMSTVDDVVGAQAPDVVAQGFTTPGLFYPYSLFHQGLTVAPQELRAINSPRATPIPQSGANAPIKSPFELVYNVIKGCMSTGVPADKRSLPMMSFFARHIRRSRLHRRFVRLPLLEDKDRLAERKGVFPIFASVRNDEALIAMQRHAAAQMASAGPVWNTLEQILRLVYMRIAMVPNPPAVIVSMGDPDREGEIVGLLDDTVGLQEQRDPQAHLDANATHRNVASVPANETTAQAQDRPPVVEAGVTGTASRPRTIYGQAAGPNEAPPVIGTDPVRPIHLAEFFVMPDAYFAVTPHCNVVLPSMLRQWGGRENYRQPTRVYVNDAVMNRVLRSSGVNREFMAHALTVAWPEEANAIMHHRVEQNGGRGPTPGAKETGKNLLLWPEEFYRGPTTSRMELPSWFQMLRQFQGGRSGAGTTGAPPVAGGGVAPDPNSPLGRGEIQPGGAVEAGPALVLPKAESLIAGHASLPGSGTIFGVRSARSPVTGQVKQHFHAGEDYSAALGTPVRAVLAGRVVAVYQNFEAASYGRLVVVHHGNVGPNGGPIATVYAHLSEILVANHATVQANQVIGKVGDTRGNNENTRALAARYNVPDSVVEQAKAGTSAQAVELLMATRTDPRDASRTVPAYPGMTPRIAKGIAGFFLDDAPHLHFEVLQVSASAAPGLRPLTRNPAGGYLDPMNRLNPSEWLAAIGVPIGTNLRRVTDGGRRRSIRTLGAEPPATPPGVAPAPAGAPPAGGAPPSTTTEQDNFAALFEVYAHHEYCRQRYAQRQAGATLTFNPYILAGFPTFLLDSMRTKFHVTGYVQTVTSSGAVSAGGAANLGTEIAIGYVRTLPEYLKDVADDAERFGQPLTAAPAEIIDELRNVLQDQTQAEVFYRRLFHGGASHGTYPAAFNLTEAMGYANGMDVEEIGFDMETRQRPPESVAAPAAPATPATPTTPGAPTSRVPTPGFIALRDRLRREQARLAARERDAFSRDAPRGVTLAEEQAMVQQMERDLLEHIANPPKDVIILQRDLAEVRGWVQRPDLYGPDIPTYEERARQMERRLRARIVELRGFAADAPAPTPEQAASALDATISDETAARLAAEERRLERVLHHNLDPERELSPMPGRYTRGFTSYQAAMEMNARPVCTLEQYIRFMHSGRTIADLQAEGIVQGLRTDYSYYMQAVSDAVFSRTRADNTQGQVRGTTEAPTAVFFNRIYRLRQGPGTPPTPEQQGFTTEPLGPSTATSGVPSDYPETRADWDKVLQAYAEKVLSAVRTST